MVNTFKKEKITAQNSTNQSHTANFCGKKELFNSVNENELRVALKSFDFGIVSPDYIVSSLKMAEKIVDGARMPEDKKSVIRNSFGFLLGALVSTTDYELIYQEDTPDGYRERLENGEDSEEVAESISYEIATLLNDLKSLQSMNSSGLFNDPISEIEEAIGDFRDVAMEFGIALSI